MQRVRESYYIYSSLMAVSVLIHVVSDFGGIFGCVISVLGILLSRTLIFLLLSFLNFSLSLAFDNFMRVDPVFYFYHGNSGDVFFLSLISTLIYCMIGWLDMTRDLDRKKTRLIDFNFPEVSSLLFFPLVAITFIVTVFIFINENFIFASKFNAYELQKYPLLEYISLIIAFMIQAARTSGRFRLLIAYATAIVFIAVALATSYRMVAIICALSVFVIAYNGKSISKSPIVFAWLAIYAGLTYLSYWRIGHFNVSVENIFGYVNGRMDNTFTGVIETAMVYVDIGGKQDFIENIKYLVGATLPLPNTFIPNSMLYIVDAMEKYRFPGGGLFSGFVIYFNFIYLIPYSLYFYIAFKKSNYPGIASGMYFIISITITRWWLYGPYVIFKFLGVFLLLMLVNYFAKKLEKSRVEKFYRVV